MLRWIKSHKVISLIIVVLVAFGLYRYFAGTKVSYQEYSVTKQDVRDTLELSGKVVAGSSATLRFGAGGLITYLGANEGDMVKKWQTLASIDSRQLHKTLEQKLNLYAIQRGTFDQTIDDNDNSVPDGDLDRTLDRLLAKNQYQLDNTVKDVEYQQLSLQLSRIYSPIAGVLIHSPIDTAGGQVGATDSWLVIDPSSLYFLADLDETDLKRVAEGQKVVVTLDAFPDREIESSVSHISFAPKETSAGTTYEVKLTLPQSELDKLRLGLNGTAAVVLTEKDEVLTLPSSALTTKDGKTIVFIKSGEKYQKVEVKTGIENGAVVEIMSGVSEGDHVYVQE